MIRMSIESNAAIEAMNRAMDVVFLQPVAALQVARTVSGEIKARAPRDTGALVNAASTVEMSGRWNLSNSAIAAPGAESNWGAPEVWWIGVGPFSILGFPKPAPPRGLIARFVRDNPDLAGKRPRDKQAAWWTLAAGGKAKLAAERLGGRYGMQGGRPRYWQAVHEGTVPGPTGGSLPPNNYIIDTLAIADTMIDAMAKSMASRL